MDCRQRDVGAGSHQHPEKVFGGNAAGLSRRMWWTSRLRGNYLNHVSYVQLLGGTPSRRATW